MDMGSFNLFLKLVREDYRLTDEQVLKLTRRLLADDQEFEKVWKQFKDKTRVSGVDLFRPTLQDLLS